MWVDWHFLGSEITLSIIIVLITPFFSKFLVIFLHKRIVTQPWKRTLVCWCASGFNWLMDCHHSPENSYHFLECSVYFHNFQFLFYWVVDWFYYCAFLWSLWKANRWCYVLIRKVYFGHSWGFIRKLWFAKFTSSGVALCCVHYFYVVSGLLGASDAHFLYAFLLEVRTRTNILYASYIIHFLGIRQKLILRPPSLKRSLVKVIC